MINISMAIKIEMTLSIKNHFYDQKGQRGQWLGVQKDTTGKMTVNSVEMV